MAAYADIHDLKLRHARDLNPLLKSAVDRKKIIAAANLLKEQHSADRAAGATPMSGPEVFQALMKAAKAGAKKATTKGPVAEYRSSNGRPMLAINSSTKSTLTVVVDRRSGADPTEIAAAFDKVLREHL